MNRRLMLHLRRSERGSVVVEYSVIASLLAIIVIACVSLLNEPLRSVTAGIGERFLNTSVSTDDPAG